MKRGFGKLGLICFALLICLAGTGVGYAAWTDTLTIEGEVNTGELDYGFEQYCCCCLCLPCYCQGGLSGLEQDLADSLGYQSSNELLKRLERGKLPKVGCGCLNHCDIVGVDTDGNGHIDKLVITADGGCCAGILHFRAYNSGTIPLKITGVNWTGFKWLCVSPIESPVVEQLEPGEAVTACYLWKGMLDDDERPYQFEVTLDIDYWNAR